MKKYYQVDYKTESDHAYTYFECEFNDLLQKIRRDVVFHGAFGIFYINATVREYDRAKKRPGKKVLFVPKKDIQILLKYH